MDDKINIQDQNEPEEQSSKNRKIWIITISAFTAFIIILLLVSALLITNTTGTNSQSSAIKNQVFTSRVATPTPTPMLFYDLTIPYLRLREYKSKLGVRKFEYENDAYEAYVTNYDSDGLKINGLLTRPRGDIPIGGFPAIVFVHGYISPGRYSTTQNYATYVDYLARNGFVIFKIDLRGHGSSEGEPGGTYYSSDYVIDTLNAYEALKTVDFIDPNKIGIWGHSMAGNIVMRSFAAKPEINAVVIWAGAVYTYVDLRKHGIQDASYQPPSQDSERAKKRQQLFTTYGQPSSDSTFWQQVAPTSFLNDLKGAIQIHHAVDDNVVNIEYSRNLKSLLDKTTIPHELHEYASGGHNITGANYDLAMRKTVEFFKENLKQRSRQ